MRFTHRLSQNFIYREDVQMIGNGLE